MKRSAAWAVASLLAVATGATGSCLAAEAGGPAGSSAKVLGVLAGSAVASAELGQQRARGIAINVNGQGAAAAAGSSAGNAVVDSPVAGFISNDHSVNGNAGITSVLQNFGNNSVMQVSTTINISVH